MSALASYGAAAIASLALIAPACAQAPQTEKNVSMKMALMIMEGALDQCSKDGYKVSVSIVDKGGNLAAAVRGDGTNPHTMEFARLKAYTARTRGQTSLEVQKLMEKPENWWITDPERCWDRWRRTDQGRQRNDRRRGCSRRARRRKG
jgi:Haem-degrading